MKQLKQAVYPSAGKPEKIWKLPWANFVQLALQLTVQAYYAMNNAGTARQNWEENFFTSHLAKHIDTIVFDNEIPVRVNFRHKIHTEEMDAGQEASIRAKEIDLSLNQVWERDYRKIHFVWEAKRVGDKRVNKRYSNLNAEYVNEAIYRFIRREYADGLSDAGILGYVLAGDVRSIVNDINASIGNIRKNPSLPKSNHLRQSPSIHNFEDVFRSRHIRTDSTSINLHHLFLSFEFA